ncbi:AAA family ATPase [Marvinbryantia sp.]|uniref:ATP-binding protein n=1 Tax=Marvinbryantia sp. TaxID=2496532 RepID=UPI003A93CBF7
MAKFFNVAAVCIPEKHYMVNLDERLKKIKKMVDAGDYFTINRARQYGKTTTLRALGRYLQSEYYVVSIDFQMLGAGEFETEGTFALSFARLFLRVLKRNSAQMSGELKNAVGNLEKIVREEPGGFRLQWLFDELSDICMAADRPIVLMIDEVDSASNNQVFLDFLAQLRAYYIDRDMQPTFQSVILAGVYDVKNLRRKIRPEEAHRVNSPWNIAADFNIDMSFSAEDIAGMLREYEADWQTGMDIEEISTMLYDYTSGYPFLVSRLCKLMDEEISGMEEYGSKSRAWTEEGVREAVKILLSEKNTLFESLSGKLLNYPELSAMLETLLFTGKNVVYNAYTQILADAELFGFIRNQGGAVKIANRIFETWLYNYYLSTAEVQKQDIYTAALLDKNQFVVNGHLNMRLVLEKFVLHFNELYQNQNETFLEEEGRKYFLLYLKPIINGVGNYYIESRTRGLRRTDVIVDYCGEQYIIELKIWRGEEYNSRGEQQLVSYLDDYRKNKGYMVSFNFNRKKQPGVQEIVVGDKMVIEAVV